MDKGLNVPKRVLVVWPKIPQMPQNLSAQFVCLSPKVLDFNKKASLGVRALHYRSGNTSQNYCVEVTFTQ